MGEIYMREMSEGIFNEENEKQEDNIDPVNEPLILTVNPSVERENKKTITQRNKEKRKLHKLNLTKRQKTENLHRNQFFRIKSIKKQVKEQQMKAEKIVLQKEL